MWQINVFNMNENDLDKIKHIYIHYLQHDPLWHFFYEGNAVFIRVSEGQLADIIPSVLGELSDQFRITVSEYNENIEIAQKYLDQFLAIFHAYSVIAVTSSDADFWPVVDRVFHCFLNVMRTPARVNTIHSFVQPNSAALVWEPMVAHFWAMTKGYGIGLLDAIHRMKG